MNHDALIYKLPGTKIHGLDLIQYDANDLASLYLYRHWQQDFRGWRHGLTNRLITGGYSYTNQAVRSLFRLFLAEWYNVDSKTNVHVKEILDNCFIDQKLYKVWVEHCVPIDKAIYAGKKDNTPEVMAYLPEHTYIMNIKGNIQKQILDILDHVSDATLSQ